MTLCRIYIFGGGQVQKKRFNDTIALKLPPCPTSTSMFLESEASRFEKYLQASEKKR